MQRVNYQARVLQTIMDLPESSHAIEILLDNCFIDDFTGSERELLKIIVERYRQGKSYDIITMVDLYPDHKSLENCISEKRHYNIDSLKEFVTKISNDSKRAELLKLATMLSDEAKTSKTKVTTLLKHINQTVDKVTKTNIHKSKTGEDLLQAVNEKLLKSRGKKMFGYSTGFRSLDYITKGIQKGTYWIIGGETNVGKTWFTQHIAYSVFREDNKILFLSLELSNEEMFIRFLSMVSKKSIYDLRIKNFDTDNNVNTAKDILYSKNIIFNDSCSTLSDIVYAIKSAKRKHNIDMVVIDYLQNIMVDKIDNEYSSLNKITLTIQRLAILEDVAIIALSQFSRSAFDKKSPGLHSFKGSGNLENSADLTIVLHKLEENENEFDELDKEKIVVKVLKNRILGNTGKFILKKDNEKGSLYEYEKEEIL